MNIGIILTPDERSKAYLCKIISNQIQINEVLFMNDGSNQKFSEEVVNKAKENGFDISKSVKEMLDLNEIKYHEFDHVDINSDVLFNYLKSSELDYVIFTGGGILKDRILSIKSKFIHFHPGITPFYRGSTCFYYSILNEGKCGVTAFIMDKKLDTGPIILQKEFDKPDHEFIDSVYDPYIRSETLVELFSKNISEINYIQNNSSEGESYYIIHPVLKHIAILNCLK